MSVKNGRNVVQRVLEPIDGIKVVVPRQGQFLVHYVRVSKPVSELP
jgi:hypothetical protein